MQNKPYVLLVGMDFSELANHALHEAFAQASQHVDSEVHVLSALPIPGEDVGYAASAYATLNEKTFLEGATERVATHVELAREKFRLEHPSAPLTFRLLTHVYVGPAAGGLVQLASDIGADLVVIGTNSRKGLQRILLGSVAEGTIRDARCPVLVIPPLAKPETEVTLDPPCPDCVHARVASAGKEFWCAQHSVRHGRRHTYHQTDRAGVQANFPLVLR